MPDIEQLSQTIQKEGAFLGKVTQQVGRVIVGQDRLVQRLLIGLLADGHVLLEGVPGLAKSLTVETLGRSLGLGFRRIQFTPDLLPADLLGTQVYDAERGFSVRQGPIFSQLILADEINRAPPKVQSALLEAMQERQVTLGEQTFALPEPFLVLATQNPIEQEGTYPLPEAELDRFLLKVQLSYPNHDEETEILRRHGRTQRDVAVEEVAGAEEILRARRRLDEIYADDKILDYLLRVVEATRDPRVVGCDAMVAYVEYGASPRASLAMLLAAKAHAFLEGRGYVTPRDVKEVAVEVLGHRLVLTFEAEAQERTAASLVDELLQHVDVP